MNMARLLLAAMLIGAACVAPAAIAQLSTEASVTAMLDDNVNNNYLRISDRVTSALVGLGYDWETASTNTQAFYTGALNYFSAVTERTFQVHTLGLTYAKVFDEDDQTLLNIGGMVSARLDRGDYTFYDNTQWSVYGNVKQYLADGIMGRASYSFRSVRLAELPDFNYTEHYGFIQGTFLLPTRTTLILEADIGTKVYASTNVDSTLQAGATGRRGSRATTASSPGVTQVIGLARIGQPLMEGTGLSLTAGYQLNLQKETRYLTSDYGSLSDDELFDDHYGFEGLQTGVMLTQLLPAAMELKIGGTLQNRKYTDRPAYDLAGGQVAGTREDTRKILTLQLEKRFESPGVVFGLSWEYITNRSNDFFYDYTNNALTVRLAFAY